MLMLGQILRLDKGQRALEEMGKLPHIAVHLPGQHGQGMGIEQMRAKRDARASKSVYSWVRMTERVILFEN